MDQFVLCVCELFVVTIRNMLGVVVILLLNDMEVFSVGGVQTYTTPTTENSNIYRTRH